VWAQGAIGVLPSTSAGRFYQAPPQSEILPAYCFNVLARGLEKVTVSANAAPSAEPAHEEFADSEYERVEVSHLKAESDELASVADYAAAGDSHGCADDDAASEVAPTPAEERSDAGSVAAGEEDPEWALEDEAQASPPPHAAFSCADSDAEPEAAAAPAQEHSDSNSAEEHELQQAEEDSEWALEGDADAGPPLATLRD